MNVEKTLDAPSQARSSTGSSLFQLVYVSSAAVPFSPAELKTLLEKSRQRNTRSKISGLLLYHDGNFMQLLEGDEHRVRATYERIIQDPRHRGCIPLIQASATKRTFPDWSMGFRDFASAETIATPGFSEFLKAGGSQSALPTEPGRALKLLHLFREKLR